MNPYAKYLQQQPAPCWMRIDMLLALFDGAIERCEQLEAALERQDRQAVQPLLNKTRMIVCGLASGVVADGDPVTTNILRLYEDVLHALGQGGIEDMRTLTVLRTLREGFQKVRPEAVALERSGAIPPIDAVPRCERWFDRSPYCRRNSHRAACGIARTALSRKRLSLLLQCPAPAPKTQVSTGLRAPMPANEDVTVET